MPASPMGPAAPSPSGSSLSTPSPSPGAMVNGIAKVRQAIKVLEDALREVGSETELGAEILKSLKGLGSKAPQSKTTAGAEGSVMDQIQARAKQQAPMLALQRAQGGGGAGPGGPPQMGMGGPGGVE